ncbi:hypothetical protein OESDEN_16689 [Oesophagostomum dentatum]|uniref:Uncharacterized protein n=1 Tax=Oesophagostomum dentatum TaxID=61180 RepID=A0A0B1SK92_OESDE|nr:hypothetical protein OESDEN_16689 [Oesophagostomum dentatum]
MFCLWRNRRRCNSSTPANSFCSGPTSSAPAYPVQQNLPQNPPPYPAQPLSCPVSYYPSNVYGDGLESALDRIDLRVTDAFDGPTHYNQVRDPSIPLPPGVVAIQVVQPSAPPLPGSPPVAYSQYPQVHQHTVYPRFSQADQDYADRQMAVQK